MSSIRARRAARTSLNPLLPSQTHLWVLRILINLNGHREFINKRYAGVNDDALAHALGLGHWLDEEDADDADSWLREGRTQDGAEKKRPNYLAELRALHHRAEKEDEKNGAEAPPLLRANVQRLAQLAGLSEFDQRVLSCAVLMHEERMLQTASGFLGDMNTERFFHALAVVLGEPVSDVRAALQDQSVLVRSGLVTLKRRGYQESLHEWMELLSGRFAMQMMQEQADPVNLLRGKVNPIAPGHLQLADYAHVQASIAALNPYLHQSMATQKKGVNIYIYGTPGTGKSQLARTLAVALDCELFEVASEDKDGDPANRYERLQAYRAAQSFFAQRKALVVFDEAEDVFDNGMSLFMHMFGGDKGSAGKDKGWINRMLESNPLPAIWLSNSRHLDPAFMRRFDMVFELPVPPKKQREKIVLDACNHTVDAAVAARLAEVETLAPAVVTRAAAVVQTIGEFHAGNGQGSDFGAAQQAQTLELLISNTLEAQGHKGIGKHDPHRLSEVYDPAFINADADMRQMADGSRAAVQNGGGARLCLYGPPGTGKTAYGRWLAGHLGRPLVVKRASDILSKWVGEQEQNLAQAFRQAEQENAVLLMDEVDSFLQDRRGASKSWEVTVVNEMLTQMEGFGGMFIASTNLMTGLDPAALRRFDLKARFDFLKPEQAAELLRRQCAALGIPAPRDADAQAVSRLKNLTPGDFAATLRQHRFHPIASAAQWVQRLQGECALKEGAKHGIGFMQ